MASKPPLLSRMRSGDLGRASCTLGGNQGGGELLQRRQLQLASVHAPGDIDRVKARLDAELHVLADPARGAGEHGAHADLDLVVGDTAYLRALRDRRRLRWRRRSCAWSGPVS
jgi:hypothetical protein